MNPREIFGRIAAWRRREQLDRELKQELQEHLALLARDLEQGGMTATEARAAAHRQLGNLTLLNEQSRDAWGFPRLEQLAQERKAKGR